MTQMTSERSQNERWETTVNALRNGLVVVDASGEIVWIDENARKTINGGLKGLALPLSRGDQIVLDGFLSVVELSADGGTKSVCVLQQTADQKETSSDFIAAIEAVLSDSWFTRTIVEKVKAWRLATQPSMRPADLDLLTDREREILALICDGRSDAEMSRMLRLSQNTVRNHVASLYRKIGVNRRSAAIIWARERALTSYEFAASSPRPRRRDRHI
jgi:DNA-binding CsgD family transcriptional regulator